MKVNSVKYGGLNFSLYMNLEQGFVDIRFEDMMNIRSREELVKKLKELVADLDEIRRRAEYGIDDIFKQLPEGDDF